MRRVMFATALAMAGCATNDAQKPSEVIAGKVEIRDSARDGFVTYTAPAARQELSDGVFESHADYRLVAKKDRATGAFTYSLFIVVTYAGDWRQYDSVSLPSGRTLAAKALSKRVDSCGVGCRINEEVQVDIPPEELAKWAADGVRVRLNGLLGQYVVLEISRNYVVGFVKAAMA